MYSGYDIAPTEIKEIQFGNPTSSISPDVVESFSIGLSVLDASLLCDSKQLYSKNSKFDYTQLNSQVS